MNTVEKPFKHLRGIYGILYEPLDEKRIKRQNAVRSKNAKDQKVRLHKFHGRYKNLKLDL